MIITAEAALKVESLFFGLDHARTKIANWAGDRNGQRRGGLRHRSMWQS